MSKLQRLLRSPLAVPENILSPHRSRDCHKTPLSSWHPICFIRRYSRTHGMPRLFEAPSCDSVDAQKNPSSWPKFHNQLPLRHDADTPKAAWFPLPIIPSAFPRRVHHAAVRTLLPLAAPQRPAFRFSAFLRFAPLGLEPTHSSCPGTLRSRAGVQIFSFFLRPQRSVLVRP